MAEGSNSGGQQAPVSGDAGLPEALFERLERTINGAVEGLTKAFDARLKPVEGKLSELGRDNARLRHRIDGRGDPGADADKGAGGGDPAGTRTPETKSAGVTPDDLSAAMALGELRAKLTDAAREDLDKMKEEGASFKDQLRLAQVLAKHSGQDKQKSGAPANGTSPKPPNGSAATAAHSDTPALPTRWGEVLKLRDSDPKAYEALWKNPEFDPDNLKR